MINEAAADDAAAFCFKENRMKRTQNINDKIRALFDCFDDSMIQSCFEGVYGELWCDDENDPKTAAIVSGDFHYLAGKPAYADEIAAFLRDKPHAVIVPSCDEWFELVDAQCDNMLKRVDRYHMRAPQEGFDKQHLDDLLKDMKRLRLYGCELSPIGEKDFINCLKSDWAYSFVSNFSDYKEFEKHGFGFVIKHMGRIVSGTSTYCYYSKGVEVEVSTHPEYRMRGLAKVTAAKFIKECISRDLAPNWDARNLASVSIAKKLGFALHDTYTAYEFKTGSCEARLPKDKHDTAAVEALSRLDGEQIEPLIPQLAEWIQDMNHPIAIPVAELLAQHYSLVEPYLPDLLKADNTDDIWKYNIIKYLLGMRRGSAISERVMSELVRIAKNPTDSEKAELADEAAKEFLENLA